MKVIIFVLLILLVPTVFITEAINNSSDTVKTTGLTKNNYCFKKSMDNYNFGIEYAKRTNQYNFDTEFDLQEIRARQESLCLRTTD